MLPFLLILAYLVLVLVRPQEYPRWADSGIPLLQITLIAALLSWLLSRQKNFDAPQYWLLGLLLLVSCASIALNGWIGGAYEQFLLFAPTVAAFVLLANATTTRARTEVVIAVFTLCAGLLALHGVGQQAQGLGWTGQPLVDDDRIQYVGIFSDPNDLAMLFVICIPMAVYLSGRGGWLGLRRLFWLSVAGLLLYGIHLTNSRGAMLALVAIVGAYLWLRRGPVLAIVLGVGCLLIMQMIPSRLDELSAQESSAMGRIEAWYAGLQMFFGSPLYGVGSGRFVEHHHLTAHNSLVLMLAETGFAGFLLWFAFIGYCFWMMWRILHHVPAAHGHVGPADIAGPADPVDPADYARSADPVVRIDTATQSQWRSDHRIALALLLSLVGYASTAFFLSRSYIILLYLLAALVVAHATGVGRRFPGIAPFHLWRDLPRWVVLAGLATVAFYLVLKILLAMS